MEKEIKILLVDDEEDFRTLMSFWLKSKGYSVESVADGNTALDKIRKNLPDVVFIDLHMPVLDGVEVLKEIRKWKVELPIIVISAHADEVKLKEAKTYGISGVFYKGKRFEEGLELIEFALKAHKKLKK